MGFKWLDFKITNRCNNRCRYCGVTHDKPNAPEILTTQEITKTLESAIDIGFNYIALLGGEPSIRENVEQIFNAFDSSSGVTLMVITNGLIFNDKMIEALFKSGADFAKIVYSFDSFNKGNYKNQNPKYAIDSILKIKKLSEKHSEKHKIRDIEIHSVISRENYHEFYKIIEFFSEKNIDVSLALVCPSTFSDEENNTEYNSFNFKELETILSQFNNLEKKNMLNFANSILWEYLQKYPYGKMDLRTECKAGEEHVIINPDGAVYPCITESYRRGLSFGNIKTESFRAIFDSMKDFRCENEFSPSCWDHFLWNKVSYKIKGE